MPYVMEDAPGQGRYVLEDAPNSPLSDFGSALAHNVMKPLHGAAQFVENAVAAGAAKLPDNPLSRAIVRTATADNTAQQQWEQQYQQSTPDNAASYTGATLGQLAPLALSGPMRGLQAAGDAVAGVLPKAVPAVLPKVVSGVAQGGVLAATNPVDSGNDYWREKGAQVGTGMALGGVVPAAASAVGGVWNAVAPIANPKAVVQAGLQRWGVPAAIDAPELVPGSLPTTAQVVANPHIVAAEKALANNPAYKPLFDARANANNAARWDAINGLAQSPQALDAAVAARKGEVAPLVDRLLTNGAPVPAQPILDQLDALAKSPLGLRPTIGAAAREMAGQITSNAATDAAGNVTIGPAHLDSIRQNVKDYLAKHAPNGAVSSQQEAAFEPVRAAIVGAIDGANPGYRDYLAKYAQLSAPINTMEAAQSIVDNLGNRGANSAGAAQLSLTGINGQLAKTQNARYGLQPEAQAALNGVQADLQRASISNSVRSPGSDTSYNLQAPNWLAKTLYGSEFQGGKALPTAAAALSGWLGMTHGGAPAAATAAFTGAMAGKKVSDFASQRVNNLLAEALLNPQLAAQLAQPAAPSAFTQGLLARIPQAGLLMSEPTLVRQQPRGLLSVK